MHNNVYHILYKRIRCTVHAPLVNIKQYSTALTDCPSKSELQTVVPQRMPPRRQVLYFLSPHASGIICSVFSSRFFYHYYYYDFRCRHYYYCYYSTLSRRRR